MVKKFLMAGLNRTLDEWLSDSFADLIEGMELWNWDDASGDLWSRLTKALQRNNISITWAEQLDIRLASMHTPGKMSWAAGTRSIRELKMRIENTEGWNIETESRFGEWIKQHESCCEQEKQLCKRAFLL